MYNLLKTRLHLQYHSPKMAKIQALMQERVVYKVGTTLTKSSTYLILGINSLRNQKEIKIILRQNQGPLKTSARMKKTINSSYVTSRQSQIHFKIITISIILTLLLKEQELIHPKFMWLIGFKLGGINL
jgi:hypothetical protein